MLKRLILILVILGCQVAFSGGNNMPQNKDLYYIQNLILKHAKESGIKDIKIEWESDRFGNKVAKLIYKNEESQIIFSKEEIESLQLNKASPTLFQKLDTTLQILKNTGNPGPGIKK